eukprot:6263884-Prorocentrum_lima.AAC.1
MTSSLVGSEMCIRDRIAITPRIDPLVQVWVSTNLSGGTGSASTGWSLGCLLYTSDAADDM